MVTNFITALHFCGCFDQKVLPVKQFGMVLLQDGEGSQMLTLHVTDRCVLAMGCYSKHCM
jgi:hypothetical protein